MYSRCKKNYNHPDLWDLINKMQYSSSIKHFLVELNWWNDFFWGKGYNRLRGKLCSLDQISKICAHSWIWYFYDGTNTTQWQLLFTPSCIVQKKYFCMAAAFGHNSCPHHKRETTMTYFLTDYFTSCWITN